MRINIEIDHQLLTEALEVSGTRTKRQVIEDGLRLLIREKSLDAIRQLRGRVRWTGDLDAMRRD